jgi:ketosteroid isomerase-like protein
MRHSVIAFLVAPLLAVAACAGGSPVEPETPAGASTTTPPATADRVTADPAVTLAVAELYGKAVAAKDFAAVASLFTDGIAWHQPGQNRFSGTHVGGAAVSTMLGGQADLTKGTLEIKATGAPMVNGDTFTFPVHFSAKREGAEMSMEGIDVFRVEGDRIAEVWLYSADQRAEDAFWGSA